VRPRCTSRRPGEDRGLGLRVDGREGVVEDQDRGVADDRAGDGGALPLAAGERDAALPERRVEAEREVVDVARELREPRDLADPRPPRLLVVGLGDAVGDVLGDGVAEEERLLRHQADVASQHPHRVARMGTPSIRISPRRGRGGGRRG
jgi:hypothetical protein